MLIVWKYTKFGRLLRPKVRKKEVKLEDLIVSTEDNAKAEGDADLDLNPVVQAQMIIEGEKGTVKKGFKGTGGRYGALRRLLANVGGEFKSTTATAGKKDKKAALQQLDRNLAKEGKQAAAAQRRADEDEKIYKQAERAALEAARGKY